MTVSIITSLYYSANYIEEFVALSLQSLKKISVDDFEFIFVVDGPTDDSPRVVKRVMDQQEAVRYKLVELSRNFGHHRALYTGLEYCKGDYVFLIDVDLEESPELLEEFWEKLHGNKGIDVIYGVQKRRKGSFFERFMGKWFYRIFDKLTDIDYPHDTTTARLMTRAYVSSVLEYRESEIDLWGIFSLTGFDQLPIFVNKGFKGTTTYSLVRKLKMATQTITSFSSMPLYLTFILGVIMFFVSLISLIWIFVNKIIYGSEIEGWASVMASVWLIGGLVMSSIGIIGIYLSKIFSEVKNRPLVHIKEVRDNKVNNE